MMTYNEEKKLLLKTILNNTFYDSWKHNEELKTNVKYELFSGMELQINSACNLDCTYCYYKHNDNLNPLSEYNKNTVLKNTDKLLLWLEKNQYFPPKIDIFSGEPLNQLVSYEIIDKVINYYNKYNKKVFISIPTNMSFLNNSNLTKKVIDLIFKQNKNINIGLSASVDGKYMDLDNRPTYNKDKSTKHYSDEFYDKLFKFGKEYGLGFHPMIYNKNIEKWKDNFLWFQENFKKYDLPWYNLYLLEVRNAGWNKEECNHFKEFLKFVLNFQYNMYNRDRENFINNNIFRKDPNTPRTSMNLFNDMGIHGRGIGCSLQTTYSVRLSDLTINPCHRLSYKHLNGFKLVDDNINILTEEPINIDFYYATMFYDVKNSPYCEACLLKYVCSGGCLGANYESTGEAFIPHPSVCLLEHSKEEAVVEFLVENDLFDEVVEQINNDKKISLIYIKNKKYGEK